MSAEQVITRVGRTENRMDVFAVRDCRRNGRSFGAKSFVLIKWLFSIGCILVLASGCGGDDSGTVTGTVHYEESPVPAGTKIFFELPGTGYVAAAKIDEQGAFKLAHKGSPEVRIGEYSVFFGPPESNLSQAEFFKLKKKVDTEFRKKGKKPPPSPDWTLPEKYYSPNTTTLKNSVVSGSNEVEIVLED